MVPLQFAMCTRQNTLITDNFVLSTPPGNDIEKSNRGFAFAVLCLGVLRLCAN